MSPGPIQAGSLVGRELGQYKILALLAIGGTAEIYLARVTGTSGFEKIVVVKCLLSHLVHDPDYVSMFLDEARLAARLDHSNIVQTLELGQDNGIYYIVMEHLAGLSLAQVARRAATQVPGGLIPVNLVLGLAAQACRGLHYAHERTDNNGRDLAVVHRDISPQNLVVTFEGIIKVVDFGIAKANARDTKTQAGTVKGKFAYMSPEQCQAHPVDRRTDVFAMAIIVHELVTGRRLFKRKTAYETYQAIISKHVPLPSQINHMLDPGIDNVVMKALSFEADERYANAEDFSEALSTLLHRRGASFSPSNMAQFFDENFAKELEEHRNRMRGLLTEGKSAPRTRRRSLGWGEEIPDLTPSPPAEAFDDSDQTRIELDAGGDAERLHLRLSSEFPAISRGHALDGAVPAGNAKKSSHARTNDPPSNLGPRKPPPPPSRPRSPASSVVVSSNDGLFPGAAPPPAPDEQPPAESEPDVPTNPLLQPAAERQTSTDDSISARAISDPVGNTIGGPKTTSHRAQPANRSTGTWPDWALFLVFICASGLGLTIAWLLRR